MKREFHLRNTTPADQLCEVVASTGGVSLTKEDFILAHSPTKGYFIAKQGLGTWCELSPDEVFYDLKELMKLKRNKEAKERNESFYASQQ